ncbi:hypothetical protein SDC9_163059 [bioreactor metagenome]|uniref:Uncharacterized protein n=1 Tax=bioreactor metagenome TaxID=1076179 RepID=A0A645FMU0_9ZZZZ
MNVDHANAVRAPADEAGFAHGEELLAVADVLLRFGIVHSVPALKQRFEPVIQRAVLFVELVVERKLRCVRLPPIGDFVGECCRRLRTLVIPKRDSGENRDAEGGALRLGQRADGLFGNVRLDLLPDGAFCAAAERADLADLDVVDLFDELHVLTQHAGHALEDCAKEMCLG